VAGGNYDFSGGLDFFTDTVLVAESIASALGMRAVHVLPLSPARAFSNKLGYVSRGRTSRVLVKPVFRAQPGR
jgi:hypothetical protein